MNTPTLTTRQVRLPAELYCREVRPGHELVRGVAPVAGERALLTGWCCYNVFGDTGVWFFVERVEDAYLPENRWLVGVDLAAGVRCRRLVDIRRLIIERATESVRWAS
jgi:hypothetical protein